MLLSGLQRDDNVSQLHRPLSVLITQTQGFPSVSSQRERHTVGLSIFLYSLFKTLISSLLQIIPISKSYCGASPAKAKPCDFSIFVTGSSPILTCSAVFNNYIHICSPAPFQPRFPLKYSTCSIDVITLTFLSGFIQDTFLAWKKPLKTCIKALAVSSRSPRLCPH